MLFRQLCETPARLAKQVSARFQDADADNRSRIEQDREPKQAKHVLVRVRFLREQQVVRRTPKHTVLKLENSILKLKLACCDLNTVHSPVHPSRPNDLCTVLRLL